VKNVFLKYSLFLTLLFFNRPSFAQNAVVPNLDALANPFMAALKAENKEIILVHTDKGVYRTGEALWFQAYCLNEESHKFFRRSKNLYVDLVNDKDSIVRQLLLNLEMQKTDGNIILPASLPEGYYWLRAYTKNILQQDANSIWVQPVYLINTESPHSRPRAAKPAFIVRDSFEQSKPVMTFFPEGGSIISGTDDVVAFRALDQHGNLIDVSGYITDTWDSVVSVTKFKTSTTGYGKFKFTAWKSRKYTVHIIWNGKKEYSYPLPLINQYAYQLSVTGETPDDLTVQVSLGDSLYKKNKTSYLIGVSRDSLCFASVGSDMYVVGIPKSKFPEGRATLLLFDDLGQIQSQRSVYIARKDIDVSIKADKENYETREKVNLTLSLDNTANKNEMALLSVAVTDDHLVPFHDQEAKWIAWQRGNPVMPLSLDSPTPEEWDLLMLTQRNLFSDWKYPWNGAGLESKSNNDDSDIMSIHGKVFDKHDDPSPKQIVTLVSKQSGALFESDTTDDAGHFYFPFSDVDGVPFSLRVVNGTGQDKRIVMDSMRFPVFRTPAHLKKYFSAEEVDSIMALRNREPEVIVVAGRGKELKPVIVRGTQPSTYEQSKRMSQFTTIITSEEIQRDRKGPNNIGNILLRTPGLTMRNGFLVMEGGGRDMGANSEPMIVVDGVPVKIDADITIETNRSPDINYLNAMESSIDFIEVLTGPQAAMYGMEGDNGAILVYSENGRNRGSAGNNGFLNYVHKGYFISPEFSEPAYDKKEIRKAAVPDLRSTIYWNGNILTDAKGNATLSFYTADEAATYTIIVTGVTSSGGLLYKAMRIHVSGAPR
jgi:hypothetical protein